MLTPTVPCLGVHAGAVRAYSVLEGLARRGVEVHLTSFADATEATAAAALRPLLGRLTLLPRVQRPGHRDPFYLLADNLRSRDLDAHLAAELSWCDAVLVECVQLAHLLPEPCPVPAVLTHLEVRTTSMWERARATRLWSRAGLLERYGVLRALHLESRGLARFRAVVALTEGDAAALRRLAPGRRVAVVPMGVDLAHYTPAGRRPDAETLLFVGFFGHPPNLEAGQALVDEIMPLVRRRRPGARLVLAGSHPPEGWPARRHQRTEVTGPVPDLCPYYHRAAVFVVPIRSGRGMRGKMLEAAACGVPTVASALAAAGLGARDGEDLLLADTAEAFAAQVERVLADAALAGRLSRAGVALAQAFSWDPVVDRTLELLERVVAEGRSS